MEEEINTYEDTLQCEADDNENEISSKKKEEYENFTKLLSEQSNFSLTPLENLGNTCYMNSILICLSHNLDLSTYFLEKKFLTDPSSKNDSSLRKLASTYYKLITDLWLDLVGTVQTSELKSVVSKVSKQFTGFSQQDAHEFLVCFLDALNDDLNRVSKKYYKEITGKKITESETEALKRVNDAYLLRNNSIVTDLFQGYYKSTITCPECQSSSINYEPFLTLQLPLPIIRKIDVYLIPCNEFKDNLCLSLYIPEEALFSDLPVFLNRYLKEKLENCRFLIVKNNETIKLIKNNEKIYDTSLKGLIFCIEMNNKYVKEEFFPAITVIKETGKNKELLSFPRIFNLNSEMKVKELRLNFYRFLRKYLNINDGCLYEKIDSSAENVEKIVSDNIQTEYNEIFKSLDPKYENFRSNLPFDVILLSKDSSNKTVIFGTDNKFKDEDPITDIFKEIKGGSRLIIEVKNIKSDFIHKENLKSINKCVKISPKEINKSISLYDLLNCFYQNEKLEKSNEWFCNNCNKNQTAHKKLEISKAPKHLIIQFNRFSLVNKKVEKNKEMVEFPIDELNLNKYINTSLNCSSIYELYGVNLHSGSTEGGHYTSIVRSFEGWHEFNDSSVYPVDRDSLTSEDVYLLFYKQIN